MSCLLTSITLQVSFQKTFEKKVCPSWCDIHCGLIIISHLFWYGHWIFSKNNHSVFDRCSEPNIWESKTWEFDLFGYVFDKSLCCIYGWTYTKRWQCFRKGTYGFVMPLKAQTCEHNFQNPVTGCSFLTPVSTFSIAFFAIQWMFVTTAWLGNLTLLF